MLTKHSTLSTGYRQIEDNTWLRGDIKFIFECSTRLQAQRPKQLGHAASFISLHNITLHYHLFKAIVLPKITYGLPVYGASASDLNAVQCFLKRCHKRRYISELINIHDLLEKADRTVFEKIRTDDNHPLYNLLPKRHCSAHQLRSNIVLPLLNTERFKNSFSNRLAFRYNLAINS